MASYGAEFKNQIKTLLLDEIRDFFREQVTSFFCDDLLPDAIEKSLDDFLNGEYTNCWLSFDGSGPDILVGLGNEIAISFVPELDLDPYGDIGGPRSQEQLVDVLERIAAMQVFIAKLQKGCDILKTQVKDYNGQ